MQLDTSGKTTIEEAREYQESLDKSKYFSYIANVCTIDNSGK